MIKRYGLVFYTALALAYLGLTFHIFCIQRAGLGPTGLRKLRKRTFEIIVGEIYAYYLTMHGIKYRTKRSAYIYAFQYLYYIGQLAYEESQFSQLLSVCMVMSAAKCIFIIYSVQDNYLMPVDHGQQVIDFPFYISHKIRELRDSVRSALYFIWIGSVYGVIHGYRGTTFTALFLLLIVSDFVRAASLCPSRLMVVVEGLVFVVAIYLEAGILMREKNPSYVIIIVNKIVLLFGDVLLSVITNMIESTGILSKVSQMEPNIVRKNKLPGN